MWDPATSEGTQIPSYLVEELQAARIWVRCRRKDELNTYMNEADWVGRVAFSVVEITEIGYVRASREPEVDAILQSRARVSVVPKGGEIRFIPSK